MFLLPLYLARKYWYDRENDLRMNTQIPISPIQTRIDQAQGYFLVTDLHSRVLYANAAIEQRTGFSRSEAIGKKPGELWGGVMPRSFYNKLWHDLQKKQVCVESVTNKTKQHNTYQEELYIVPITTQQQLQYFVAFQPTFQNSKEKKEATARLKAQVQQESPLLLESVFSYINRNTEHAGLFRESSILSILEQELILPTKRVYAERHADEGLIRLAQQDNQQFALLYNKYKALLFDYVSRHLSDTALAEDLVQETFARAFARMQQFLPSNATYQTYLFRIAHNLVVNEYRRKQVFSLEEQVFIPLRAPENIQDIWETERISFALKRLSPLHQQIIDLFYMQGYSVRAISEQVHKTENAVKLHLSRARKLLKEYLEP